MRRLLSAVALALFASPAVACINDSELPGHEREFRSSYQQTDYRPPEPPSYAQTYLLGGAGVLLGVIGAGIAVRYRAGR